MSSIKIFIGGDLTGILEMQLGVLVKFMVVMGLVSEMMEV